MLTRISNITSFEFGTNVSEGRLLAHTNIVFHYQGEYYASRIPGEHLTLLALEVEEERFLERRHRRRRCLP